MQNLRSALSDLATSFTESVLAVIRSASIDELLAEGGASAVGNGRRARTVSTPAKRAPRMATPMKSKPTAGRLPRRSAEEIATALDGVVAFVKKNKEGLRAEQIRAGLGLLAKEMPRILKEGLSTKKLKARGQKRATTYFAS